MKSCRFKQSLPDYQSIWNYYASGTSQSSVWLCDWISPRFRLASECGWSSDLQNWFESSSWTARFQSNTKCFSSLSPNQMLSLKCSWNHLRQLTLMNNESVRGTVSGYLLTRSSESIVRSMKCVIFSRETMGLWMIVWCRGWLFDAFIQRFSNYLAHSTSWQWHSTHDGLCQ